MKYQIAQINIAKFRLPMDHPANTDFVDNLDRVNAAAEQQPGFVWRLVGDGNNALGVNAFNDPDLIINLSVWENLQSLVHFVYRQDVHKSIMRRRKEWFEKMDFHMALWWIEENRIPTIEEAKIRLELLKRNGPTYSAFTFKQPFVAPTGETMDPFKEDCA